MFLCYGSRKGAAFIDRALYLPKEWTQDTERLTEAGVPEEASFKTKPRLAEEMMQRALEAEVPCSASDPAHISTDAQCTGGLAQR